MSKENENLNEAQTGNSVKADVSGSAVIKAVEYWTQKELKALHARKWDEDIGQFDSLVILPTRQMHDSGYRCMDFVAVKDNKPLCRLNGCSDVIHIDGIGGYGYKWSEKGNGVPLGIPAKGWSIDCLKVSGLLRLFADGKMRAGRALSSFDIYAEK